MMEQNPLPVRKKRRRETNAGRRAVTRRNQEIVMEQKFETQMHMALLNKSSFENHLTYTSLQDRFVRKQKIIRKERVIHNRNAAIPSAHLFGLHVFLESTRQALW